MLVIFHLDSLLKIKHETGSSFAGVISINNLKILDMIY